MFQQPRPSHLIALNMIRNALRWFHRRWTWLVARYEAKNLIKIVENQDQVGNPKTFGESEDGAIGGIQGKKHGDVLVVVAAVMDSRISVQFSSDGGNVGL